MMGLEVEQEFLNEEGGVESILLMDDYSVVLSGDNDQKRMRSIERPIFERCIKEHKFLPHIVEKPKPQLTEYQVRTRDERLLYLRVLKELVTEGHKATVRETYDELIKRVERLHPHTQAATHPKRTTLCKQWKIWCNSNFHDDDVACKRREGRTRVNTASEALLNHHISTIFSDSNSTYKRAFYRDYRALAEKESIRNSEIYPVSERTYSRRLGDIREHDRIMNMQGLTQAQRNQHSLTLRRKIKTYFALQRVECDRVCINMSLIDDETGEPTPTISLYVAIDVYTRCIVGAVLSFNAENKEDGFNLLRQIYLHDENLPMHGKPLTLIMDNGKGFNSQIMHKTIEALGVTAAYAPSNQPAKKPFIESFFKTLRADFFSGFRLEDNNGKVTIGFNSYKGKRTDKNVIETDSLKKIADIKVSDFLRLLNQFLSEYHNQYHREAGHVPIVAWQESQQTCFSAEFSYDMVRSAFHMFQDKPSHKLQPAGKVYLLNNTFSNPDELKSLYNELKVGSLRGNNPEVNVFFDPFDARKVTVQGISPSTGELITRTAYNVEYSESPTIISFDELHGLKPKSIGIYQSKKLDITGRYQGRIASFVKQKRRKPPYRGPQVNSFDDNNVKGLTSPQRIARAQEVDSKALASIRPNMHCIEQDGKHNASTHEEKHCTKDNFNDDQLW